MPRNSQSTASRLISGAAWTYGAQILTVVLQFGYAAITSRVLDAGDFGAYAVALSISGLFTLLASAGMTQTAARFVDLTRPVVRPVFTYAVLVGFCSAVLLLVTAVPWTLVWGTGAALPVLYLLSLNALTSPAMGLATGILRRRGEFRTLAWGALGSNMLGMAVGLIFVVEFRSAVALAVSSVVALNALLAFAAWRVRDLVGLARISRSDDFLGFSWRVTANSMLQYLIGNAPRIGAANFAGPAALGQWNRADVVSTVPFQQIQASIVPVVYPEFRHHRDGQGAAFATWAKLLSAVGWVTVPLGALAAGSMPFILPVLLGPGWDLAGRLVIPLAIAGGIQPVISLLAAALESRGDFKAIWLANAVSLTAVPGVVALVYIYESVWPAILAGLSLQLATHGIHLHRALRQGLLDGSALKTSYFQIAIASAVIGLSTWFVAWSLEVFGSEPVWLGVAIATVTIEASLAFVFRERFGPYALALELRLVPGRR